MKIKILYQNNKSFLTTRSYQSVRCYNSIQPPMLPAVIQSPSHVFALAIYQTECYS